MSPLGTLESPPRTEQGLDMSKADADILSRPDVAEIRQAHDAVQADFNAENESGPQDSTEGQSDEGAELGASSQTQKNTKEDIIAEIAQTGDSLLRGLGVVSTTTPVTPSPPAPQPTAPPISVPHTPQSPQAQPPQSRPTGHDDVLDLRLGIVDQTRNGRALADVAADARLGAETNESRERGRLKAIGHSLWKMGTLKGIFRRHYSNKAFAESVKSQDIYKHIDADEQDRKQAKINAVVRALEGNYSESMGEQRRELSKDSQLYKDLTSYLVEVTDTQRQCPTEEEVEGEYQRILAEHPDELYGGGMITSHNFYELVLKARGANVNRESVVHAIENMPIIMAESRLESNENLRRDRTEKILDWVDSQGKKNKLLSAAISIAPETAVTLGITAAATLLGLGRDSLIRNAGRLVFFGVGGATVGAMRARRAARQQIRQHRVERTLGLQYDLNDKNREKLEELRYETKPYSEMVKAIYDTVDQEKITQGGDEALKAALLAIAEVQERRGFFEKGYDVIGFTEGLEREGEISEFENARKYAFNVLSPLVRSLDADTCNRLGIPHGAELKKSIKHFGQEIWQVIQNNIDDVKKLENGYVNSKALGGAAMGGFFATAGTLVVGEAVDIVKSHFSGISAGNLSQSPMVDQYNGVKMNGGYHMVPDRDGLQMGNYDIQDANGNVVVDNLKYDPSTGFDGDSLTKLHGGEFNVTVGHHAAETTTQQVSIGDYINKHPTEFQKLNVQWMDNDTAQFDLNEQGMRLTSNPDGSITLGQVMTEYGSSHGGSGINMTDPSYTAVDMAFKQPDGSFAHHVLNIKQGDQIPDQWKPFFQERGDGTWVFNGGEGSYASLGKLDGDKFYSAAAIPNGTGEVPTVTDTIETSPAHVTTELKGPDHDSGLAVGIVGVPGTRGLTAAERKKPQDDRVREGGPGFYYGYGGIEHNLESIRNWLNANPSLLKTRTRRPVDGKEEWFEADGSPVERTVGRERTAIGNYLERMENQDPSYHSKVEKIANAMGAMHDSARVAVCVPAWMEEKSIRKFLDQYMDQVNRDGSKVGKDIYEVNVLVNRKTGTQADGTVREIEHFISEFETANGFRPNVRYFDIELDPPNNNVGYARKLLTDATIMRSLARTGQGTPLYIETEDADIHRLDKKTVINLIEKMDANPHLDAVRGVADRDPSYLKQNDMLFIRRRLWDFSERLARTAALRNTSNSNWNYMWNRTWMNGWNAGFSAEAYADSDGYDPAVAGEDLTIGEKFSMIRGDGHTPNLEVIGTVSTRSDGSPRRFIAEVETGTQAYAPGQFENKEVNELIRNNTTEQLLKRIERLSRINKENESDFTNLVKGYFDFAKKVTPNRHEAEQLMGRTLFFLGFKKGDYEFKNGKLEVYSWDNVKNSLDVYRTRRRA